MGFSFLQTNNQSVAASAGSVTFASITTTAGSYLICSIQNDNALASSLVVSDNVNGNWVKIVANDNLVGEMFEIWHLSVNIGGSITIKVTGTALSANMQLIFGEYKGQLTSGPLDSNTALTENASGTAYGPLTTNVNGDALIWIGFCGAGQSWTANAGFNSRSNNNANGAILFDSETNAATAGMYSFTGTSAGNSLVGALVAVKTTPVSGNGSWMSIALANSLRGSQRAARRHRVKGRL
jgi:hypothetical protein